MSNDSSSDEDDVQINLGGSAKPTAAAASQKLETIAETKEPADDSESEDSSSDEDDVAIVLDSSSRPATGPRPAPGPRGRFERKTAAQIASEAMGVAGAVTTSNGNAAAATSQPDHPILQKLPFPNDKVYELDIDELEDKPWRRAGADVSDWFNYGFDETTWKAFAQRQLALRDGKPAAQSKTAASLPAATPAAAAPTATAPSVNPQQQAMPSQMPGGFPFFPQPQQQPGGPQPPFPQMMQMPFFNPQFQQQQMNNQQQQAPPPSDRRSNSRSNDQGSRERDYRSHREPDRRGTSRDNRRSDDGYRRGPSRDRRDHPYASRSPPRDMRRPPPGRNR